YRALETIRQYGTEQLELASELDPTPAGHERGGRAAGAAPRRASAEAGDAWGQLFHQLAGGIRAALLWGARAAGRQGQAAELAAELAGLLYLRGRPAQAQRSYEQAANLAATRPERVGYLRLAAGAAATRWVGKDTLRLLRAAADVAVAIGDRG